MTIGDIDLTVYVLPDREVCDLASDAVISLIEDHLVSWTTVFMPTIVARLIDDPSTPQTFARNDSVELSSDKTGPVSFLVSYYLHFPTGKTVDQEWAYAYLEECLKHLKQCFFQCYDKPDHAQPAFNPSSHDDDLSQLGFGGLLTEPLPAHLARAI